MTHNKSLAEIDDSIAHLSRCSKHRENVDGSKHGAGKGFLIHMIETHPLNKEVTVEKELNELSTATLQEMADGLSREM